MTERLKKDIIKLIIDKVVIEGESVRIFATIPLPNKIHEREMDKTDIPGTSNGATLGPVNETNMARIWNKHKQSNTPLKRKVFVGLSGGVDSAVTTALLKRAGVDVVGAFIKTWYPEWLPNNCGWREERRDAMRVAAHLNIPFVTIDLEKEYKKSVVDYMIAGYKAGRTPNPDVMCNKEVKLGAFLRKALAMGADYIATGHYAQNQALDTRYQLLAGKDNTKDQSYFLWTFTQEQLSKVIFPVGHLLKSEVRELARQFKLPVAEKRDSQGICFLGHVDTKDFLAHYIKHKSGDVLNDAGKKVGEHAGAIFYTLGQRYVPTETTSHTEGNPLYVIAKNTDRNTLTVSKNPKSPSTQFNRSGKLYVLRDVNWISGSPDLVPRTKHTTANIRYHGEKHAITGIGYLEVGRCEICFVEPVLVAPGQSVVFYDGNVCLGGGVVE